MTVADQSVVNAVEMIRTFIFGSDAPNTLDGYEQISPKAVLSWTEDPSLAPFTAGNAIALRNWPYAITEAGRAFESQAQLGVMPIPYATTQQESKYDNIGGPVAALGGWHNTVNPNSNRKPQALEVIQTMTQPSFQRALVETTGWLPPNREVFGSRKMRQIPVVGDYIDQLKVAGENAIPRPVTAVWPQESTKIAQQVHAGISGDQRPRRAMETLKDQLLLIENYNS